MPRSYDSLTLEDAKRMLSAAEAKAASLGIAYNIAIVDAGGHLVAFVRQDGALIGSIDLAIDKAVTARIFDDVSYDAIQDRSVSLRHSLQGEPSSWPRNTLLSAHAGPSNLRLIPIPPSSPSVTALTARRVRW